MITMLIAPLILHFIADFLLQSREMGKKKSSEFKWLYRHLRIQFGVMLVGMYPVILFQLVNKVSAGDLLLQYPVFTLMTTAGVVSFIFAILNTIVHGIIDWNIWKLYKLSAYARIKKEAKEGNFGLAWITESGKNWQYWEDHWFYATIGFDQLLHTVTIVLLAYWLS